MAFQVVIVCALALFQTIAGQCIGSPFNSAFGLANGMAGTNAFAGNGYAGNGFAGNGLTGNGYAGNGYAANSFASNGLANNNFAGNNLANNLAFNGAYGPGCSAGVASTGGGLPVTSSSPIAPTGVSVVSENVYEGSLSAGGNLPFLGTVAFEGTLPTAGAGAVSYGCGDGVVGIASEGPIATGIVSAASYPPASPAPAAAGLAGLAYNNGVNGIGLNGLSGFNGFNGVNGFNGFNGFNGLNGFNGVNGLGRFSQGANCAL